MTIAGHGCDSEDPVDNDALMMMRFISYALACESV